MNNLLVISSLDATASAGIMLDSHIAKILKILPFCVMPSFLVQNHSGVKQKFNLNQEFLLNQLNTIEYLPKFVKIGALQNPQSVQIVGNFLKANPNIKAIVDTPIVSSSSTELVEDKPTYIGYFKKYILPHTYLLTPNLLELSFFGSVPNILQMGCNNILLKGGHSNGKECTDCLYTNNETKKQFSTKRIMFKENVRGTGCALSTAIACFLTQGMNLKEAIQNAKMFVFKGIENSIKVTNSIRVLEFS